MKRHYCADMKTDLGNIYLSERIIHSELLECSLYPYLCYTLSSTHRVAIGSYVLSSDTSVARGAQLYQRMVVAHKLRIPNAAFDESITGRRLLITKSDHVDLGKKYID